MLFFPCQNVIYLFISSSFFVSLFLFARWEEEEVDWILVWFGLGLGLDCGAWDSCDPERDSCIQSWDF